jgi:hypothetical protein
MNANFELLHNIMSTDGLIWVRKAIYPVVNIFDNRRVIVDVGKSNKRELVIIPIAKGIIRYNVK